jgi:hypothetical protein
MSGKSFPFWQLSPNTFLLGAGASRATFPNGDKFGRKLPLMNDFVKIVGLEEFFNKLSIDYSSQNIEEIYSELYSNNPKSRIIAELNELIIYYFSALQIPDDVTIYDELILSLQKKDAIFSFNWDPLIMQCYIRNLSIKELPQIYFLHGNVFIGICEKDKHSGYMGTRCSACGELLIPSKILFPIKEKEYSKDPFIKNEWGLLNHFLSNSFIFTIFGYGAPITDIEARGLMINPWKNNKRKEFNEIEVIDVKSKEEIDKIWGDLFHKDHRQRRRDIRDTLAFRYPRRSCEAFGSAIMQVDPWKERRLPKFKKLKDLQDWIGPLVEEEVVFREKDVPLKKFT